MKRRLPCVAAVLLSVAAGIGPAFGEAVRGVEPGDVRVRFDWQDVGLIIVAAKISELVELPVLLDVSAQSDQLTINMPEALPPKEAAHFILDLLRTQRYRV